MKVAVVGHGTSLTYAGLGKHIDTYDHVIRMVGSEFSHGDIETYGEKCTAVYAHSSQLYHFNRGENTRVWLEDKTPIWCSHYAKQDDVETKKIIHESKIPNVYNFQKHMNRWYDYIEWGPQKITKGTAAIICAVEHLKPESITLFGFDNLVRGNNKFYGSAKHGGVGLQACHLVGHNLAAEKKIVAFITGFYKIRLYHFGNFMFNCTCELND